jgi:hypothetical protein
MNNLERANALYSKARQKRQTIVCMKCDENVFPVSKQEAYKFVLIHEEHKGWVGLLGLSYPKDLWNEKMEVNIK